MVNLGINDLVQLHIRRVIVNYDKCRVQLYFYHEGMHKLVLSVTLTFICKDGDDWTTSFAPSLGVDVYANENLLSRIHKEMIKDFEWFFED